MVSTSKRQCSKANLHPSFRHSFGYLRPCTCRPLEPHHELLLLSWVPDSRRVVCLQRILLSMMERCVQLLPMPCHSSGDRSLVGLMPGFFGGWGALS